MCEFFLKQLCGTSLGPFSFVFISTHQFHIFNYSKCLFCFTKCFSYLKYFAVTIDVAIIVLVVTVLLTHLDPWAEEGQ